MGIHAIGRLVVALLCVAALGACSGLRSTPMVTKADGTTMPQDTYLEEARLKTIDSIWRYGEQAAKPPDSAGNVSAEGEVSHTWFKDDLTEHLSKATQSVGSGKFDVDIVRIQERHATGRTLINNMPWFLTSTGAVGGGSSSGSKVEITAEDGSRIDNVDMTTGNRSPFMTGDDAIAAHGSSVATQDGTAANRDGQVQSGDGTQGQAVTRPTNQPNPQNEAPINNNSEGLGFDGSL